MGTNFFEFRDQVTAPKRKDEGAKPLAASQGSAGASSNALTVTQLTSQLNRVIRSGFPAPVLVRGEVSNYRPNSSSGHVYFRLKDSDACLNCVMWKSDAVRLAFTPADGMELLARGSVGVFGPQGRYQLYVSSLQPLGQGALELAFQQLRAKLEAQGLFAPHRKRPLPRYPMRIVLVTGSQTAALQDMLKVLRRFPWLRLFVYHVSVQGDGCGSRIADGLAHLTGRLNSIGGADVVLLSRGGGSLEDLWGFNEEAVARAVANCCVPVVTGIGHEVDTTIADLVADYHAHTPTEAAQVIITHWRSAQELLSHSHGRLSRTMRAILQHAVQRLTGCERHEVFRRPLHRVNALRQVVDDRERVMQSGMGNRIAQLRRTIDMRAATLHRTPPTVIIAGQRERLNALDRILQMRAMGRIRRQWDRVSDLSARLSEHHPGNTLRIAQERLEGLARHLAALAPERVLKRGYSITTKRRDGSIVRNPNDVKPGERIVTRVAEGEFESRVEDAAQPRLFE
jgi:exodeoxyribonuclease VII large subunit